MKVVINIVPEGEDEEVCFRIHSMDSRIEQSVRILTKVGKETLLCKREDAFFKINVDDILYLESVERKIFVYTNDKTLEVAERLYVLEEQLSSVGFIRVSKSMLLNFTKIYSFYPKFSGNLEALLVNKEKVIISRRYVPELKRKLGLEDDE